ncbi:hypothetical protein [Roseibium sp.]|uniref:hypothetical protein n=1 Tax=Roseibium sp. TaxID=1936156 RepID=UPI003D0E266E
MKTVFDFILISVVGFVVGGWIMIGAGFFGMTQLVSIGPVSPSEGIPSFEDVENQIAKPTKPLEERKIDPGATHAWLQDGAIFVDEIKYLEEENCSDHAMRLYAQFIEDLDTSGFDRKTGRLIDGEGKVSHPFAWKLVYRGQFFMLHPLQYMKDDMVPANFKHVMKAIPRKRNWETCKFKIPFSAVVRTFN